MDEVCVLLEARGFGDSILQEFRGELEARNWYKQLPGPKSWRCLLGLPSS